MSAGVETYDSEQLAAEAEARWYARMEKARLLRTAATLLELVAEQLSQLDAFNLEEITLNAKTIMDATRARLRPDEAAEEIQQAAQAALSAASFERRLGMAARDSANFHWDRLDDDPAA